MAASPKVWIDNSAPQCNASDLNGFNLEINNLISSTDTILDYGDHDQTAEAVAIYASSGNYYVESGVANAYVLSPQGNKKDPPTYVEGEIIRFIAGNTNTGPSTVNRSSLGLKNLLNAGGSALIAGEIQSGQQCVAYYNGAAFVLMIDAAIDSSPTNDNIVIGGNFGTNPWQRGTSFSVNTATSRYTADRFKMSIGANSTAVVTVSRDASVVPSVVISKTFSSASAKILCTTADAAPAGAVYYADYTYPIEGSDFQQIAQQYCVVRFLARASKIGTYCVAARNSGNDRSYVAEYTITQANTWEEKIIVIPPSPAAGSWNYGNGLGLSLSWQFMPSSLNTSSGNQWLTGNFITTSNQVNLMDTVNATFYIDMIKVEPGTIYTGFSDSLAAEIVPKCQRYFYKTYVHDQYPGQVLGGGLEKVPLYYLTTAGLPATQLWQVQLPAMVKIPDSAIVYSPVTGAANKIRDYTSGADFDAQVLAYEKTAIIEFTGGGILPAGSMGCHLAAEAEIF